MNAKRSKPSSPPTRSSPSSPTDHHASKDPDRLLPIANVSRLMKKSLPANAKISKEAKETVQECVSEFISFITGEASDKCQREKRKTINGDDLLWAMTTLGFENYVGPLKNYLSKFRELEEDRNFMGRQDQELAPDHHHQQHQHQSILNGHMSVGDLDKVVSFGGNQKRDFHEGLMAAADLDTVVSFGGNGKKLVAQSFNGVGMVFSHADADEHLGTSSGYGSDKLQQGMQW